MQSTSKIRIASIKKHGQGSCVPITKELEELGWKQGDYVKVEPQKKQIVITLVEEVA